MQRIVEAVAETLFLRGVSEAIFKDKLGRLHGQIKRQIRGYKINDPVEKKQQPLSPRMLRRILRRASGGRGRLVANLLVGAFFFACRSCEYVRTSGEPRTRIVRVEDIEFMKKEDGAVVVVPPGTKGATAVRITFRWQKNLQKDEAITQHASGDKELCPVIAWGYVCKLARAQGRGSGGYVNAFEGSRGDVTYTDIMEAIRGIVGEMATHDGALHPEDFGTHSVRSGAALAMYLSGTAVVDIMLEGRWSSDAFLEYIKRQVLERSAGISTDMVNIENFDMLPQRKHRAVLDRSKKSLGHRGSDRSYFVTSPSFHLLH